MRVVVTGASGNVGTSVLRSLADEPSVEDIVGIARRIPALRMPKVTWQPADVSVADLGFHFRGADAVIHLAWLIQPGRDERKLRGVNIGGTERVLAGVRAAGVPNLLYASSVGAYSPGPGQGGGVDESWPTAGIRSALYSRQKAEVESLLDEFERTEPGVRVVRMRPALIFKREAGAEIRRLFAGPLLPSPLLRPGRLPVIPLPSGLRFQAVHSYDVGDAFRRALIDQRARGAYNLAAEPVLDRARLADALQARVVEIPRALVRGAAAATFAARLQPSEPGWLDMALEGPLMSTEHARAELGWEPHRGADSALLDLLTGIAGGDGLDTPPLSPGTSGPLRVRELAGAVGGREIL